MDDHQRQVEHASALCKRRMVCVDRLGKLIVINAPREILRGDFNLVAHLADEWLREHGFTNPGVDGQ
jgi:hypothetical protein